MTATEFVKNKYTKKYSHYIIKNGRGFYLYGGKYIPSSEFEKMFPTPLVLDQKRFKGDNPNKRILFLKDKQSY